MALIRIAFGAEAEARLRQLAERDDLAAPRDQDATVEALVSPALSLTGDTQTVTLAYLTRDGVGFVTLPARQFLRLADAIRTHVPPQPAPSPSSPA